jgi:FkbH-like protein
MSTETISTKAAPNELHFFDEAQLKFSTNIEPAFADLVVSGTRLIATYKNYTGSKALRIFIIGSATTDFAARAISIACVQENLVPVVAQGLFGAYAQDILQPDSALYQFKPDIVVILSEWRDCVTAFPPETDETLVAENILEKAKEFQSYWSIIRQRTGARIIHHLAAPPPQRYTGVAERRLPGSFGQQVISLNNHLIRLGAGLAYFVDLERFAEERGLHAALAQRAWYGAKLPFEQSSLPAYVPLFRAVLRQATAKVKKCLVLDLDNTLWGGVIGDDGIDGIKLGAGDPAGEAFSAFQDYVLALSQRGIILAVCSKNEKSAAMSGFDHPSSRLKLQDFSAFEASWDDKASAIQKIAKALNIDVSALVFVDDNPAECALVQDQLPGVAVICLGTEPAEFIDRLERGYWFELNALTQEDFARTGAYQARAAANEAISLEPDLQSYLKKLQMRGRLYVPAEKDITRLAQLEQKTNQFNLLTRRYDEAAIRNFLSRDDSHVHAFTLSDKFGDHGLVSLIITIIEGDSLRIDDWLMSCRIFSRTAEQFIIKNIAAIARAKGLNHILGEYKPTEKNHVVHDLFERLNFTPTPDGKWVYNLSETSDDFTTYVESADDER